MKLSSSFGLLLASILLAACGGGSGESPSVSTTTSDPVAVLPQPQPDPVVVEETDPDPEVEPEVEVVMEEPDSDPEVVIEPEPEPETEPEPVDEGNMSLVMPSLRPGEAVPIHQNHPTSSTISDQEQTSGVFDFGDWSVPYLFVLGRRESGASDSDLAVWAKIQDSKIPDHFSYSSPSPILERGLTVTYSRSDDYRGLYFTNENPDSLNLGDSFIPDRAIVSDVSLVLSTPPDGTSFTISDFVIGRERPIIIEGSGFSGTLSLQPIEVEQRTYDGMTTIDRNSFSFQDLDGFGFYDQPEIQAQYKALQDAGIMREEDLTLENVPTDRSGLAYWHVLGRFSKLHNEDNEPRVVVGNAYLRLKTGIITGVFAAEPE